MRRIRSFLMRGASVMAVMTGRGSVDAMPPATLSLDFINQTYMVG